MRTGPSPLQAANLVILLLLALLLFSTILGLWRAPVWLLGAVFLARLGVQLLRARTESELRRPFAWALDVVLLMLLFTQTSR